MSGEDNLAPVSDPVLVGARAAARRLVPALGPGIEADVEAALHVRVLAPQPQQYFDPISLGGLVVSVATLAWSVYTDLRSKTPQQSAETIARAVRVQLRDTGALVPEQRDRIIEVVIDEVIHAAPTHE
jgi:hypothetical protein